MICCIISIITVIVYVVLGTIATAIGFIGGADFIKSNDSLNSKLRDSKLSTISGSSEEEEYVNFGRVKLQNLQGVKYSPKIPTGEVFNSGTEFLINPHTGAGDLLHKIRRGFPFTKYWRSKLDIQNAIDYVRKNMDIWPIISVKVVIFNMPWVSPKFNNVPQILQYSSEDYHRVNWFSNFYNDHCRLSCRRYDEKYSPIELFNSQTSQIYEKSRLKLNGKKITPRMVYETIYDTVYGEVMGCNNFRLIMAAQIVRHFGAKRVLDPCAGWGDRLAGTLIAGAKYIGFDPNQMLEIGHNQMAADILGLNSEQYKIHYIPYEESTNIKMEPVDLVLTSPPYFTLEKYSNGDEQSIVKYVNVEEWKQNFLGPLLELSCERLAPNGYIVIAINDIRNGPSYTEWLLEYSKKLPLEYLGCLPYADRKHGNLDNIRAENSHAFKSPQPLFIWKKFGA